MLRNLEFSEKEIRAILDREPLTISSSPEDVSTSKEHFVFLRSLFRTKRSLQTLLSPILDSDFSPFESSPAPSSLLVDHILHTLRFPQLPLPQNLDEIMCLMQSFQKQPLSCL